MDCTKSTIKISVYESEGLILLNKIIGWLCFCAWSLSFYPQIYENWRRKSVIGLNFDFLALNVVGYICYSAYNTALFWNKAIQEEYKLEYGTLVIPAEPNDVAFGLHGIFACLLTISQCLVYERGDQRLSLLCSLTLVGIGVFVAMTVACKTVGPNIQWLDCLTFISYAKLFVTFIKQLPQAYMNFRRKSTVGWSIWLVLLDFTGGLLSIGQMVIATHNFNDWSSFWGDPTKFGIALFSNAFDILFILQHYVFYRTLERTYKYEEYQIIHNS